MPQWRSPRKVRFALRELGSQLGQSAQNKDKNGKQKQQKFKFFRERPDTVLHTLCCFKFRTMQF